MPYIIIFVVIPAIFTGALLMEAIEAIRRPRRKLRIRGGGIEVWLTRHTKI